MGKHAARRADKGVFVVSVVLMSAFTLYAAGWLGSVLLSLAGIGSGYFFGINITGALSHMATLELALFFLLCSLTFITQVLLVLRRRAAVFGMGACVAIHFVFWVRMSGNPVWDSPIGLVLIALETLILLLFLRLQHAGWLR